MGVRPTTGHAVVASGGEDAIEWHVEWAFRYAFQENVFFFVLPESCDLLS